VGINLYLAKTQKENGKNPAFSYFVSGMCFSFGLTKLIELFLK
jgi:formate/nitrite transporter FocA (FNT family)